jgi:hypothetical protein
MSVTNDFKKAYGLVMNEALYSILTEFGIHIATA